MNSLTIFVLFSVWYSCNGQRTVNYRSSLSENICDHLDMSSLDALLYQTKDYTAQFATSFDLLCGFGNLTVEQHRIRQLFQPLMMCSLAKNMGGLDQIKFESHRYVAAYGIVLCENTERKTTLLSNLRSSNTNYCKDPRMNPYCEMIKFFFWRDDPRRQLVCNAMKVDDTVDCPVTQVDPRERCQSENKYEFSWNFLRYAAFEEDGMEFFKKPLATTPREFYDEFNVKLTNNIHFKNVFHELREVQIVQSQLYLHFMVSSLILNNLGKAARETDRLLHEYCEHGCQLESSHKEGSEKHDSECVSSIVHKHSDDPSPPKSQHAYMKIECDASKLFINEAYTIGFTDLKNFIRTEDTRCVIICLASVFGVFMNIYMVYLVFRGRNRLQSSGVTLVFTFAFANLLFLVMNLYFVWQQFHPIFKERKNVDFFRITNYTRYYDETYLAAVSALRLTLNDRYGDVNTGNFSTNLVELRVLFIVENFLVNFSRSIAASVMILIICSVFYELRSSFCGRLKPKVKLVYVFFIWFGGILMLGTYIYVGMLEYNMIYHLNDVMGLRGNDQDAIKRQCERLRNEEHKKDQLKGHAYFMIFYFVMSVFALLCLFAYHKYKVSTSENGIPQNIQEEMQKSWTSLTIASLIYIASNFGTIFVEIQSLTRLRDNITSEDVQYIAELYRWLYLLALIDPIVHPWILIYRIKTLRLLHQVVQKEWNSLQLKSILRKVSATFTSFQKPRIKKKTRFDDERSSWSSTPRQLRASVQQDLQWMLNFLENEKKVKMGELTN